VFRLVALTSQRSFYLLNQRRGGFPPRRLAVLQRMRVNVMGATGRLGRRVIAALLEQGARPDDLVLSVRDPAKASSLGFGALDVKRADYDDTESLQTAFRETDVLLLIPTSEPVKPRLRQHANALTAARRSRVERLVFSSFQACGPNSRLRRARFYHTGESSLQEIGLAWTILRSGLYLEFIAIHVAAQLESGKLMLPVQEGRVACIGRSEVARGLAAACLEDGHEGRVYELTGAEALSMADVAAAIAAAAGRPIEFAAITGEEYAARCRERGLAEAVIEVWLNTWEAVEAGELERTTNHLELLTGRPPLPLADQLRALLGTEQVGRL
jgi:NAD(P)H dehydrogenase (quinone)